MTTDFHSPTANADEHDSPKRAQILAGARAVFLEHGFAGSSMAQIARTAGVSKGTLYNYFASKEALFVALITGECRKPATDSSAAPETASPAEVLAAAGSGWLLSLLEDDELALFRIVLAESLQFPELGRLIEAQCLAPCNARLAAYLASLDASGQLAITDCALAAEQFLALCDAGILRRVQFSVATPARAEIDAHVASAVRLFLAGYAPRP
ncbi:TetR/AcrR family transcriptional regulator [Chitinilyticum litopenaei]|uniref:TetR/AcrR family transcriptional regulator n=1 Tax=Chitinilyticum litopenaei TaxID=1121276 RepID=UPI00041B1C7E|nr:TetR/AcrR family transcriptional regulator [Chitinilyticum litopenaei]